MKQHPWLFLVPTLLLMSISAFVPLMTVINYSLHYIFAGSTSQFVGLQNYAEVMGDSNFQQALLRQLVYSFMVLLIEIFKHFLSILNPIIGLLEIMILHIC